MKNLILSALFVFIISLIPASARTEVVDRIIAKVGSEVITQSDLEQETSLQKKIMKQQSLSQKKKSTALTASTTLENLILKIILGQAKTKLGIFVADDQVEAEYNHNMKSAQLNERTFAETLAKNGFSIQEYKGILKEELEKQTFIQKIIMPKLNITDYELEQYYKENLKTYMAYKKLRFIEVFLTGDSFSDQTKLMDTAKQIHESLKKGGLSSELIKKYSSGAFAQNSGDSGVVEGASLRAEIQNILNQLKPGETSEIIPVAEDAVFIFKLISRSEPTPLPYTKAMGQVRQDYARVIMDKELKKHLLSVKEQTYVEILK